MTRATTGATQKARQNRDCASFFPRAALALAVCLLAAPRLRAADTNQISPEFVHQILERLDQDERELKELRQLVAKPAAPSAQISNTTPAPSDNQMRQRLEKN